jgi:hypothetical protein
MKFGKLPEGYKDGECPYDALENDDYFFLLEYEGSCQNCEFAKFPKEIWVVFVRTDGIYHVFIPMEDLRCGGCGARVGFISVMCANEKVDVTGEFGNLGRDVS